MLKPIKEATQDVGERFYAIMNGWDAIDPDTGAYLYHSNGRTKAGDTKYILVIPDIKPEKLFGSRDCRNERTFKRLRAWNTAEAIEIANKKLEKVIKHADR